MDRILPKFQRHKSTATADPDNKMPAESEINGRKHVVKFRHETFGRYTSATGFHKDFRQAYLLSVFIILMAAATELDGMDAYRNVYPKAKLPFRELSADIPERKTCFY